MWRVDVWRWAESVCWTERERFLLAEFMIKGIFLSPLNTPISPSHSPRARAAAELAVDSRSIYSKHTHTQSQPSILIYITTLTCSLYYIISTESFILYTEKNKSLITDLLFNRKENSSEILTIKVVLESKYRIFRPGLNPVRRILNKHEIRQSA